MGPVANTNDKILYGDTIRNLWNDLLDHPDFDQHWKDRNVLTHLHDIKTPATLVTGGWYDAEDSVRRYQHVQNAG
jgi:predicted acyl esterase